MRNPFARTAVVGAAAALALSLAACGPQDGPKDVPDVQDAPAQTSQQAVPRSELDPAADGRIDVTSTGEQVATFRGDKYIVSDGTVDQATGEAAADGLGLQEICVVHQPAEWQQIGSIGWGRNLITYERVAMPWGTVSFGYEYHNEASPASAGARSNTSEEEYFNGAQGVEHTQANGHDVAYLVDEQEGGTPVAPGIRDLEAQAAGDGSSQRYVTVYAYEQRAEDCALATRISCEVTDPAAYDLSAAQLVEQAYAPLEFLGKDAGDVAAASYLADVTIASEDGQRQVVLRRDGADLVSYTEHGALLATLEGATSFEFASPDEAAEAQEVEVDGRTWSAHVAEAADEFGQTQLRAWTDLGGSSLRVVGAVLEGEDVTAATQRLVGGRVADVA